MDDFEIEANSLAENINQLKKDKNIQSLVITISDESYSDKESIEYLNAVKIKELLEAKTSFEVNIKNNTQMEETNNSKLSLNLQENVLNRIQPIKYISLKRKNTFNKPYHLKLSNKKHNYKQK